VCRLHTCLWKRQAPAVLSEELDGTSSTLPDCFHFSYLYAKSLFFTLTSFVENYKSLYNKFTPSIQYVALVYAVD